MGKARTRSTRTGTGGAGAVSLGYVVSEVLGHTSIAMTKDVYGHLPEAGRRSAAELMSRALFSAVGSRNGSQNPGVSQRGSHGIAAILGTLLAGALGVDDTEGIDWIKLAIQVAFAAVGVALAAGIRGRRTH